MPRKRQTKVGRVDPIDVRNKSDVKAFEGLLGHGPLTIVLVYADWCGHCQTFKETMWNKVNASPNKKVNTASVHYDMVENTSLKNSKIDGYPSLLLVGTNKTPATFETDQGKTNAMPSPQTVEELKNMVNAPIETPVSNANSVANTVVNNANNGTIVNNTNNTNNANNTNNRNTTSNVSSMTAVNNSVNSNVNVTSSLAANAVNTYEPEDANNLSVPDTSEDLTVPSKKGNTLSKVGGGAETLLSALTRITAEAGHAGALLLAATEYSDFAKRFTRKLKKRSKKTAKRKQRR